MRARRCNEENPLPRDPMIFHRSNFYFKCLTKYKGDIALSRVVSKTSQRVIIKSRVPKLQARYQTDKLKQARGGAEGSAVSETWAKSAAAHYRATSERASNSVRAGGLGGFFISPFIRALSALLGALRSLRYTVLSTRKLHLLMSRVHCVDSPRWKTLQK